jgi:hypothetical protein
MIKVQFSYIGNYPPSHGSVWLEIVYRLARHPDATLSLAFINESGLGFGGVFEVGIAYCGEAAFGSETSKRCFWMIYSCLAGLDFPKAPSRGNQVELVHRRA